VLNQRLQSRPINGEQVNEHVWVRTVMVREKERIRRVLQKCIAPGGIDLQNEGLAIFFQAA
jgi:hypothetical protein